MHIFERRRRTANSSVNKFFVSQALLAADYVSFRDEKSRALVYEIGFTGESRVRPDSAYDLDIAMTNGSPGETRAQPLVGFAPMPYPDPDPSAEKINCIREFHPEACKFCVVAR